MYAEGAAQAESSEAGRAAWQSMCYEAVARVCAGSILPQRMTTFLARLQVETLLQYSCTVLARFIIRELILDSIFSSSFLFLSLLRIYLLYHISLFSSHKRQSFS